MKQLLRYVIVFYVQVLKHFIKLKPTKFLVLIVLHRGFQQKLSFKLAILEILFNKSQNSGKVTDIWKPANVNPIHKKGDKALPDSDSG